jgi:hypothetical protein
MSAWAAVALTIVGASTLVGLPLIPAVIELRRKSDAGALSVVQQHAGEIRHFADSFRSYVAAIEPVMEQCRISGTSAPGSMRDGTPYLVFSSGNEADLLLLQQRGRCKSLIATVTDLRLPGRVAFSKDIFARGDIQGGEKNEYRAIFGEREVHLASCSTVLRWVHANGKFRADDGCRLFGRVSSDRGVHLAAGCSFLRLNAPRVELGCDAGSNGAVNPLGVETSDHTSPVPSCDQRRARPSEPTRKLHDGDFELWPGEIFRRNLIVRGKLRIGDGVQIHGSVKSEKDLSVGDGVVIGGSLISERKLHIGKNCSIHGPVIAEREVLIQTGTRCGTEHLPTTVSAPRIVAEEGVLVFGTVWARELGSVVTK